MSTQPSRPSELPRAVKFGTVGLLNTALGYSVILAGLSFGMGDIAANVAGFTAGLFLSFILNSCWTFDRAAGFRPEVAARYIAIVVAAYAANVAIIMVARGLGIIDNPLTHLVGIGTYSIVSYLGFARFVFVPGRPSGSISRSSARKFIVQRWPEVSTALCLLIAFLALRTISVSHDVTWQMWIARQMLGGAALYRDILELNPPLWFWMALPVEWSAQAFAVPPMRAIVTAVFLLIVLALALFSQLVKGTSPHRRAALLAVAFVTIVVIPIPDFAQREHLALIAAIPYVALIARRADGHPVDWRVAAATGLLGSAGFALKHYFVLVPLLLDLWLLFRLRRNWAPFRAETLALVCAAVVYAIAVLVLARDFFTTMVPMVNAAYSGYEVSFFAQFLRPFVPVWALTAVVIWQQRKALPTLTFAFVVAAVAFSFAYFAQQKGWRYHSIPTTALLFFAVVSLWRRHHWESSPLPAAVLAISALFPVVTSLAIGPYNNVTEVTVRDLLRDSRPRTPVLMLTSNPSSIWPIVEKSGLQWPSRHFSFWMLPAMVEHQKKYGNLTPELDTLADDIRRQTVEDLRCNVPDIILVDDFRLSSSPGFDILEFFRKNKEFEQFFSNYTFGRKSVIYTSYKKSPDWQPEPPAGCRTIY